MSGLNSARRGAHEAAADARRIVAAVEAGTALALRATVTGQRDRTTAVRLGIEGRAAVEAAATAGLTARKDMLRGEIAAQGRRAALRRAACVRAIEDGLRVAMAARPAGAAKAPASAPPVPGARLAPDGHYYVALPHRHGRFHRVTHHESALGGNAHLYGSE